MLGYLLEPALEFRNRGGMTDVASHWVLNPKLK
jgi:hypothetical protein